MEAKRTLDERLAAMLEQRGLPQWMRETVGEARSKLREPSDAANKLQALETLQDELSAMGKDGTSWPDQLAYAERELSRILGAPATRHLRVASAS